MHGQTGASQIFIQRLLEGKIPLLPRASFGYCDVRDVARAHLQAMTLPSEDVAGKRHLIMTQNATFLDVRKTLNNYNLPDIPELKLSNFNAKTWYSCILIINNIHFLIFSYAVQLTGSENSQGRVRHARLRDCNAHRSRFSHQNHRLFRHELSVCLPTTRQRDASRHDANAPGARHRPAHRAARFDPLHGVHDDRARLYQAHAAVLPKRRVQILIGILRKKKTTNVIVGNSCW